jgi:uncharacterized protein YegP (UPF0339 family)
VNYLTFHYWKSATDGRWYWHAKAPNHEVVATASQGYQHKESCLESIELVQKHAATAAVEMKEAR